jgi:hypothetical protein
MPYYGTLHRVALVRNDVSGERRRNIPESEKTALFNVEHGLLQ